MLRITVFAAVLALASAIAAAAETAEHGQVAQEACGANPQAKCLSELRKVCHDHFTFRCYYSRKGRLDAIRNVGFPDDRVHIIEE